MDESVFDYSDYVDFLRAKAGPEGTRRGVRLAMSKALGCHSSYLTKVMNGSAHLSLEQALDLTHYFSMSSDEAEYFLLLVEKARAGTQALRMHFEAKLTKTHLHRFALKERVSIKKSLTRDDQAIYYGSWFYAAIHMALTVSSLRTRLGLANYFNLPEKKVGQILRFLVSVGLAVKKGDLFLPGQTQLHLEGDSPNISKHHTNWRTRAIFSLDRSESSDLHYSGVFTLSRKDAAALREKLIKTIQHSIDHTTASQNEEEVYCFALDFFGLKQDHA